MITPLRVIAVFASLAVLPMAQAAAPAADRQAIQAAVASPDRLPADREEDAWRAAPAVLEFLGARPGMSVVDVVSGGGYFTELLSRAVGPRGSVTAQNPEMFLGFVGKRLEERYGNDRLPNVKRLEGGNTLSLPADAYDAALLVNIYHELYVVRTDGRPQPLAPDPQPFVAELFKALKKGGVAVVEDHVAAPGGTPVEVATALHRVDPEVVKKDFAAAGFVFDGENNALRNPDDDHSLRMGDESVRRKTDRFLLRFRKP